MQTRTIHADGTETVLHHGGSEVFDNRSWTGPPAANPAPEKNPPEGPRYVPAPGECFLFDVETNGLLDTLTRVHCLVIIDAATGEVFDYADDKYGPGSIEKGLRKLMTAKRIVGHNIIKFDIPAITKVFPWFSVAGIEVEDTLVESRLIYAEMADSDMRRAKKGNFPGRHIGSHALEAWGYRLGVMKGEYGRDENGKQLEGIWDHWSDDMHAYCIQDVRVTMALWSIINAKNYAPFALMIEHRFAEILAMQERYGFGFNVEEAQGLYADLVKVRLEIAEQLRSVFPPKEVTETFIPKVNSKKFGYVKGVPFTKRKLVEFNPSSRQMIAERLKARGWQPIEFTPSGQPKIDESILSKLDYPEAAALARHFLVEKRIGQLAEGDQAWLRLERNGRIHGSVNTNGAVTGRCTHSNPNVAQVPKVKADKVDGKDVLLKGEAGGWGWECRNLFGAFGKGRGLVGADLAGVELRCLAHYMARYDNGAYGRAVVEGSSKDGTDVHSLNAKALGLDPKGSYVIGGKVVNGRDLAKTFIYAFLYGAGDEKLGVTIGVTEEEIEQFPRTQRSRWNKAVAMLERQEREYDARTIAAIVKGGVLKARFLKQTPALARLREDVAAKAKATGKLKALDGRTLTVRHAHAALNTLLQNAGALVAKLATILAYDNLSIRGFIFGRDWALVAHIHDELQVDCKEAIRDEVGKIIVQSMREAGRRLGFRVPIDGEHKLGKTWADTH